jgi:TonB family protein
VRRFLPALALAAAAQAAPPGATTLPRLLSAGLGAVPWSTQSGGIAAYDVRLDESGSVTGADIVQDVAPYGELLGAALPAWRFEPAREEGRPVPSRVLVLGFFRPPALIFAAPENPRYKGTVAPDAIPWPSSVGVPAYPPNAFGGGGVILEVDISEEGDVTSTRVLTPAGPFDGAAAEAARQWKFRPASRGNRDVAARAFLVFTFAGTT